MSIQDTLLDVLNTYQKNLFTCLPARVVKFDNGLISAIPLIKQVFYIDNEKTLIDLPQIDDIPVLYPVTNKLKISFKLYDGDQVLLIFSNSDINGWINDKPDPDLEYGTIGSCFAIPSALTKNQLSEITFEDNYIIEGDMKLGGAGATDYASLASKVKTALDLIKSHTHTTPGGPAPASPDLTAMLTDVKCTKVKIL